MTVSSLPHYPKRPKPTSPPERNGSESVSSRRMTSLWLRIVWAVGIWGALFAFRATLLSGQADPPKPLVGRWETADGRTIDLEFTDDQRFEVFHKDPWGGTSRYTGEYQFLKDDTIGITILQDLSGRRVPKVGVDSRSVIEFKAVVDGDYLTVTEADGNERTIKLGDVAFPPPKGESLHFKRKR
jgi:hypothetical protein